ncbi:ROK family protein [Uliginosibacterium sp. H1]|uniref:ROK family protein n=1 Tax=Uliginosibacterium sp. H1 TaxID=3114757 RepID=UPI002E19CB57|nr:ROK family protein [Uliginosibacterium sp. H1]
MAPDQTRPRIAALEVGGTKCICAVGRTPVELRLPANRLEVPSDAGPQQVLSRITEWFAAQHAREPLQAIGIASFGPLDLDPASPSYGSITSTPKPGWRDTDWLGAFARALPQVPVAIDTDVNGAALGEWQWGAAQGLDDFVYLTMGTGIGGGAMVGGRLVHGLLHPEMGHMRVPRIAGDDFAGVCPFHGDCWEGLCSGPALQARTGKAASALAADDPAWDYLLRYTAYAIGNIVCALSPRRIILGGSVRKAGALGEAAFFAGLRRELQRSLNGYVASAALTGKGSGGIDDYIVPPTQGDDAGICGAMVLAQRLVERPAVEG